MNGLFAETLKKLRAGRGLSQRELANRMCVTRSTVALSGALPLLAGSAPSLVTSRKRPARSLRG